MKKPDARHAGTHQRQNNTSPHAASRRTPELEPGLCKGRVMHSLRCAFETRRAAVLERQSEIWQCVLKRWAHVFWSKSTSMTSVRSLIWQPRPRTCTANDQFNESANTLKNASQVTFSSSSSGPLALDFICISWFSCSSNWLGLWVATAKSFAVQETQMTFLVGLVTFLSPRMLAQQSQSHTNGLGHRKRLPQPVRCITRLEAHSTNDPAKARGCLRARGIGSKINLKKCLSYGLTLRRLKLLFFVVGDSVLRIVKCASSCRAVFA
jgi:hypothetical protein